MTIAAMSDAVRDTVEPAESGLFRSIASKIFGLAIFLLLLTISLSLYLLSEVNRSESDIAIIARHDLPLAEAVEKINEYGLRRRLAFERWFGALNRDQPNTEVLNEAVANYEKFTPMLQREFGRAREIVDGYPANDDRAVALAGLKTAIENLATTYPDISKRQREIIELQQQKRHDEANRMLNVVTDSMRLVQTQRARLSEDVAALTRQAARAAEARQQLVRWLTIGATASAVTLGLLIAAWVARRVTRPVRSLTRAIRDVRAGHLEVQLAVESRDEIGNLTDSFNYFVRELQAKEEIKRTFGKYVDPRVLERVLAAPGAQDNTGEKRVMTVSFGDLVGFTHLSEHLTPALMVTLLNRHFGLQSQCVQDQLGIVDKYIGDAIMAFWGPPFVDAGDQAALACMAALRQVEVLQTLRMELPELTGLRKSNFVLDSRIGISTGEVVVGNIGSETSRSYTVIGDTVNLASRLEGANRIYGTHILINVATADAVRGRMEVREIDMIAVKGRVEPVVIFELMGVSGQTDAGKLQLRERYGQALAAYRGQAWRDAAAAFRTCLEIDAEDQPSRVMLDRCERHGLTGPASSWNGVWQLDQK